MCRKFFARSRRCSAARIQREKMSEIEMKLTSYLSDREVRYIMCCHVVSLIIFRRMMCLVEAAYLINE